MNEQEIAAYREQMFGSNGQSSNQPPTPDSSAELMVNGTRVYVKIKN